VVRIIQEQAGDCTNDNYINQGQRIEILNDCDICFRVLVEGRSTDWKFHRLVDSNGNVYKKCRFYLRRGDRVHRQIDCFCLPPGDYTFYQEVGNDETVEVTDRVGPYYIRSLQSDTCSRFPGWSRYTCSGSQSSPPTNNENPPDVMYPLPVLHCRDRRTGTDYCYLECNGRRAYEGELLNINEGDVVVAHFRIFNNGARGRVNFAVVDVDRGLVLAYKEKTMDRNEYWNDSILIDTRRFRDVFVPGTTRRIEYVTYYWDGTRYRMYDEKTIASIRVVREQYQPQPPTQPPEEPSIPETPPVSQPYQPPNPKIPEGIYVFPYRGRIVMVNNTWNENKVSVVDKLLFIPVGGGGGIVKAGEAVILAYEHILAVIEVYSEYPFTVLNERGITVVRNVKYWKFVNVI